MRLKLEKADDAFQVYKSGGKMTKELYYDIVKFLVPLYDPKTAPSKLNSLKKAKSKLDQFEEDYGSKWDVLMEIKLAEYQRKLSGAEAAALDCHLQQFRDALQLDVDSDSEDDHNVVVESAPPFVTDNNEHDGEEGNV